MEISASRVIDRLKVQAEPEYRQKMAYFNIPPDKALGVRTPVLRKLAKEYKNNHELALELWASEVHEARLLAAMIDDPRKVDREQMENWLDAVYSWDLCDGLCFNLFHRHAEAWSLPAEWVGAKQVFRKRAAFALMAKLALGNKKVENEIYCEFLNLILKNGKDERNMVKKGVSWALRQIGKRNLELNANAIEIAEELSQSLDNGARWAGKDALRELQSRKILDRLADKE